MVGKDPFRSLLVWYEFLGTTQEAIAREKALKKWNREWKIRLIESHNPTWADLYNQLIQSVPRIQSCRRSHTLGLQLGGRVGP